MVADLHHSETLHSCGASSFLLGESLHMWRALVCCRVFVRFYSWKQEEIVHKDSDSFFNIHFIVTFLLQPVRLPSGHIHENKRTEVDCPAWVNCQTSAII